MAGWSDHINDSYPKASVFDYSPIETPELLRFAQIIMTEGVPYACSQFPLAYEFARERSAWALNLDPKQVSLVGSARIGYSLSPSAFGQPFDESTSDLDLFAVDSDLFDHLRRDFEWFLKRWDEGSFTPTESEKVYWESSKKYDPKNVEEGFLDPHHIPLKKGFETADRLSYAALRFHKNLAAQAGRQIGSKAKMRVYQDWPSAIKRIKYNIRSALKYRSASPGHPSGKQL